MQRTTALPERFSDLPGLLYAHGFPRWKRPVVRQCFAGRKVVFLSGKMAVPQDAWTLLWGMAQLPEGAREEKVIRMEDGFLRSVGLGADLTRPLSWVADRRGIYYDATRPSDLEHLLATTQFDEALTRRGAELRARIVQAGLTKYNVGVCDWRRPEGVARVVLVPGQVESDASLAYGAPGERGNMGMLKAVRAANPDAYLIYKPHPDVVARMRLSGQGEAEASRWCDEVVTDADMGAMLEVVDEVHVLTSLSGFEALLRGKRVTCYGQPFYSGWGLTTDLIPQPRRQRRLSLDQLTAGALILYPFYLERDGRGRTTPEQAVDALLSWRERKSRRESWWLEIYRIFLRRFAGVR